jgi:uncharacterized membrane protein YhaH (DUF805 family)
MDFMTAVRRCLLDKYADFNGRASRPEFWWFMLFVVLVSVVGDMVFRHWITALLNLALLVPSLSVGARRFHDINKSGWLQLLGLIPLVGWALVIYWAAQPGQPEANAYGPPPADAAPAREVAPGQQ